MSEQNDKLGANQNAHRAVTEATEPHEKPLPADLEAAWERWLAGVGKVDARGIAMLRAAFEAGWDASRQSSS